MSHEEDLKKLKKEDAQDNMVHVPFELKVEIDDLVFHKIMHWINKEDFECSGLGKIVVDHERNVVRVVDAILLKQKNDSSASEIDGQAICRAMHEFRQRETPGELKWWWHSHVDMGVFWSGTDHAAIKCLGGGDTESPSWFLATVFNQRREMLSAYVQNRPVKLVQDNLQTIVRSAISQDIVDQWNTEYDEKVELPTSGSSESLSDDQEELFKQWQERMAEKEEEGVEAVEEDDEIEYRSSNAEAIMQELKEDGLTILDGIKSGQVDLDDLWDLHEHKKITDDDLDKLIHVIPGYGTDYEYEEDDKMDIVHRRGSKLF
jgi:hypothetical protein